MVDEQLVELWPYPAAGVSVWVFGYSSSVGWALIVIAYRDLDASGMA